MAGGAGAERQGAGMPFILHTAATRALTRQARHQAAALLAGADDPHDELLAMVWGPRFDREHGLTLAARQPVLAGGAVSACFTLPALLSGLQDAADSFDALEPGAQHRLRTLILRHRRLRTGASHDNAACTASC